MLFLGVEHKETYFNFALTGRQIEALKFVLDHATIEYDSEKEPFGVDADKYLREGFYPVIKEIVDGE